jgi:hypothetical protein
MMCVSLTQRLMVIRDLHLHAADDDEDGFILSLEENTIA